jgi:hypothetical protein
VAWVRGNENSKVSTAPFSVAAIPYDYQTVYAKQQVAVDPTTGAFQGIRFLVLDTWKSDSGDPRDLDQVLIAEHLEYTKLTGTWQGTKNIDAPYDPKHPGSEQPQNDSHIFFAAKFQGDGGDLAANQVHTFWDKRTDSKDMVVTGSGYKITKDITFDKNTGLWHVVFEKKGADVTANKYESSAGSTEPKEGIEKMQDLPLK